MGTPEVQAEKGPSQTDSHVRNATHKSNKPGAIPSCLLCSCPACFPHIFLLQECCFLLAILPPFQCLVAITPALSTEGKVTPPCPGVPPPHTHSCCTQSSRELGIFGCRGTGRACSHVPFLCSLAWRGRSRPSQHC